MDVPDLVSLTPRNDIAGDEAAELLELEREAAAFLSMHPKWFKQVLRSWLYRGFAHLAVFLFEVEPDHGADSFVWVIIGDVPAAFIDLTCHTGGEALRAYLSCMREWVKAVANEASVERLIPVYYRHSIRAIAPNPDFATQLSKRLDFVETVVMPAWGV